ncbi:MAG: phenylalanine--tRNA ligase subunit beta [Sphingomonadales bacterium]
MTLSYQWLLDYLPAPVPVEQLSEILTSIGLEVERVSTYEEVKGGLQGLLIAEVLATEKHPNADKLTLTKVAIGQGTILSIVCGAPNVAAGQKVVVAPVGATIYPVNAPPLTMKNAKIRGEESQGMICAEDEIGLGDSHAGIMVLPPEAIVGTSAADYFSPYTDTIIEIGLTPNRMDAMSHWGVARDVCAYLNHHQQKNWQPRWPQSISFSATLPPCPVQVHIENKNACPRYSGLCIDSIQIGPSPVWMQQRLKAIGVKPINNIVDITNYVLHETGQPLHAFDRRAIEGQQIVVRNVSTPTHFITLDGVDRKLSAEDLMICHASQPMCMAGVYGGLESGINNTTTDLFLESAFFDPVTIRKTSFGHQLRTDAATRFEKGTDIGATLPVLQRAAQLITTIAGGMVNTAPVDCYPSPQARKNVSLSWAYLKKISGKDYVPAAVCGILESLGFTIIKEESHAITVTAPYHKPDITLAADLVEEILRIDGLDNIPIPGSITISPAVEQPSFYSKETLREKISDQLAGMGYHEIMTNSITNSAYFPNQAATMVTMINSLSTELNALRVTLLPTALEVVARNLNHRSLDLRLFEFGTTYSKEVRGSYLEESKLCLVLSGQSRGTYWQERSTPTDLYTLKGAVELILSALGIRGTAIAGEHPNLQQTLYWQWQDRQLGVGGLVAGSTARPFGIKQPVYYAELNWNTLSALAAATPIHVQELPRFPSVERDLALVVSASLPWQDIEQCLHKIRIKTLRDIKVFDIFESDKLGAGKKSIAIHLTFSDPEKTLTDKEIEGWMNNIIKTLEKELEAAVRK